MYLSGELIDNNTNQVSTLEVSLSKDEVLLALITAGNITSAYKLVNGVDEYAYGSMECRRLYTLIQYWQRGCTSRNSKPISYVTGVAVEHTVKNRLGEGKIIKNRNEIVGIVGDYEETKQHIEVHYAGESMLLVTDTLPWVHLTKEAAPTTPTAPTTMDMSDVGGVDLNNDDIPVRTIEEIALEKDVSYLRGKDFQIIDSIDVAERIFDFLETYSGTISFDVETTGKHINVFSRVGGEEAEILKKYQEEHPAEGIKADYVVGFSFSWVKDHAYYFPAAHRKFANLYDDRTDPKVLAVIEKVRRRAAEVDPECKLCVTKYLNSTSDADLRGDVILMLRVRDILSTRLMLAHNGAFEWRACFMYSIIFNLVDDTMLLHQLLVKFDNPQSRRGEPSNLKYLAKKEFGWEQTSLEDYFVGYEEEADAIRGKGLARKTKKSKRKLKIDFSYMTYNETRAYAPMDVDVTLYLLYKYKRRMLDSENKKLVRLYEYEVTVAMAIAYMEFFGHRIDEAAIEKARQETIARIALLEEEIQRLSGLPEGEKVQISSPKYMASLFFDEDKLAIPAPEVRSVSKKVRKQLTQYKNDAGELLYPIVGFYHEWQQQNTLLTKFFDNLPDFMYPGGYIFSSYFQIDTATGRMCCRGPNAQQYPKIVTKMVQPKKDCIMLDIDYSQIEYRVLASLAHEQGLIDSFKNPDSDYHTTKAAVMFDVDYSAVSSKMRSEAKKLNFGIPYGMGLTRLAIELYGMKDTMHKKMAAEKYELYFKGQDNVRQFFVDVKEGAMVNGYTLTKFGRWRKYNFYDKDGKYSESIKAMSLRQAGNAVIQGTAADIFKIAMARVYTYIKANDLFDEIYLTNMVHDECLYEVNVKKLNPKWALDKMSFCMQLDIDGFPPLYVGAGIGMSWYVAKGGDAEIHPDLLKQYKAEAQNETRTQSYGTPDEVKAYFDARNEEFRRNKAINYLLDESTHGKLLSAVISGLIIGHFNYDKLREDDPATIYKALAVFIERNNLPVSADDYLMKEEVTKALEAEREAAREAERQKAREQEIASGMTPDLSDDNDYDDEEDADDTEAGDAVEIESGEYELVNDDMDIFGASLKELVEMYGVFVSRSRGVCGIDARRMTRTAVHSVAQYLEAHIVESTIDYVEDSSESADDTAVQRASRAEGEYDVMFLTGAGVLMPVPYRVEGINADELTAIAHC